MTASWSNGSKKTDNNGRRAVHPRFGQGKAAGRRSGRRRQGQAPDDGKLIPLDVKAGDRILFGKYSGTDIKLDGNEYLIMREDEVLGVLEGGAKKAKA